MSMSYAPSFLTNENKSVKKFITLHFELVLFIFKNISFLEHRNVFCIQKGATFLYKSHMSIREQNSFIKKTDVSRK